VRTAPWARHSLAGDSLLSGPGSAGFPPTAARMQPHRPAHVPRRLCGAPRGPLGGQPPNPGQGEGEGKGEAWGFIHPVLLAKLRESRTQHSDLFLPSTSTSVGGRAQEGGSLPPAPWSLARGKPNWVGTTVRAEEKHRLGETLALGRPPRGPLLVRSPNAWGGRCGVRRTLWMWTSTLTASLPAYAGEVSLRMARISISCLRGVEGSSNKGHSESCEAGLG
jgi:hypothetical protein